MTKRPGGTRARTPRRAPFVLAAALLLSAGADAMAAADASGYVELTASKSEDRTREAGGREGRIDTTSFLERYSLDLNWSVFPNMRLAGGGFFERQDAAAEDENGVETDTTQKRLRPYLTAALRNAIFNGTFGFYRTRDDSSTGGLRSNATQDLTNLTLGWRPESAPEVTLRLLRTHTYDDDRQVQDVTDDLADLVGQYRPIPTLQLYYRGALEDNDDHLSDTTIRRTTQSGRVTYGDAFLDRRIEVAGEYDVNHFDNRIVNAGTGEVTQVLFPDLGLSLVTDLPTDGALTSNPALINGDRDASAGVDLGLQPVGGDERPRNIGLFFSAGATLNTLDVWVDRDLPQPIALSFSWDVYTSDDPTGTLWVFRETVSPAIFGPFDHRFEIRFASLTAHWIKVVSRPLGRSVPNAASFPNIFVTELTAALRTPAADARLESVLTNQVVTASTRVRLLDKPMLDYESAYFLRRSGDAPSVWTLSNGLSLRHAFDPIYSVTGRIARENGHETEGDRATDLFSTSLRAAFLPTLQSSATWSGRTSEIEGRRSDSDTVYVFTSADLYRGVNTSVGFGLSRSLGEDGTRTDSQQVNAQATLVPHPSTTVNLLYQTTRGTRSGGALPDSESIDRSATQASVAVRPFPTLYLFFSYRVESSFQAANRFIRNFAASWAPFPDGTLQIILAYDESYQSDQNALTKIASPRVRWNITDRWYAELAYQGSTFVSGLDQRDSDSLTATTRIWF